MNIAQYGDGSLELMDRGQPLAFKAHVVHGHLRTKKSTDDKTLNARVDALTKQQRKLQRLKAEEIAIPDDMRSHGIHRPDTHVSLPVLGQTRYGLRPAQSCPSG